MSNEVHARIRGKANKFNRLLTLSALAGNGDPYHENVYLEIQDGRVDVLQQAPGEVVLSYCTFTEDFFTEIENERDQPGKVILDVDDALTYLDIASSGGTVEMIFKGQEDAELATVMRSEGALETEIYVPASQDILDGIPNEGGNDLTTRFDDDQRFGSAPVGHDDRKVLPTSIRSTSDQVDKIIQAVDVDSEAEFYPVSVSNGEFLIDIGGSSRQATVHGSLSADEVDGPDVDNDYFDGFKDIFHTLSGNVWLQTAPDAPLCVVQNDYDGMTIRHVNGAV